MLYPAVSSVLYESTINIKTFILYCIVHSKILNLHDRIANAFSTTLLPLEILYFNILSCGESMVYPI